MNGGLHLRLLLKFDLGKPSANTGLNHDDTFDLLVVDFGEVLYMIIL